MTGFDPFHRNWLHLNCTQSSPMYSMFLYLPMLFLVGKLISAGAPEMLGVLVYGDRIRINMSEWVSEGAVCTSYQKLAELAKFPITVR